MNDYPAIASGTMEHVDTAVYTRLARDLLLLVVAPKLDGADPTPGGWCQLKLPEERNKYNLDQVQSLIDSGCNNIDWGKASAHRSMSTGLSVQSLACMSMAWLSKGSV